MHGLNTPSTFPSSWSRRRDDCAPLGPNRWCSACRSFRVTHWTLGSAGDTGADSRQYRASMWPRAGASRTAQRAARERPRRAGCLVAGARGCLAIGRCRRRGPAARAAEGAQIVAAPIGVRRRCLKGRAGDGLGRCRRRRAGTAQDALVHFGAIYGGSADTHAVPARQRPALAVVLDDARAGRLRRAARRLDQRPGGECEPPREVCRAHARNIVQNRGRTP
jgi:hypothetical protein